MTEQERKDFLLLQGRVLALEDRLKRFEDFWGWKKDDEIGAYTFTINYQPKKEETGEGLF